MIRGPCRRSPWTKCTTDPSTQPPRGMVSLRKRLTMTRCKSWANQSSIHTIYRASIMVSKIIIIILITTTPPLSSHPKLQRDQRKLTADSQPEELWEIIIIHKICTQRLILRLGTSLIRRLFSIPQGSRSPIYTIMGDSRLAQAPDDLQTLQVLRSARIRCTGPAAAPRWSLIIIRISPLLDLLAQEGLLSRTHNVLCILLWWEKIPKIIKFSNSTIIIIIILCTRVQGKPATEIWIINLNTDNSKEHQLLIIAELMPINWIKERQVL